MTDTQTQAELDAMPANRERQYADLFAAYDRAFEPLQRDAADDQEEADRAIDDSILAIEQTRGFQVTISTGGPGEWLECTVAPEDSGSTELESVTFCCAWWSEVQRTPVREGSGLWRLAERMNPWGY